MMPARPQTAYERDPREIPAEQQKDKPNKYIKSIELSSDLHRPGFYETANERGVMKKNGLHTQSM